MFRRFVFVSLMAVLAGADVFFSAAREEGPEFYGKYEMAPYEIVPGYQGKEYEKRRYPGANWAVTDVRAKNMDECQGIAFMRLFQYINGENKAGQTIPMTVPVLVRVKPREDPEDREFRMGFFVPREFQADPPAPTSPEVTIKKYEDITVYTKQYTGYSSEGVCIEEYRALSKLLERDNVTFDGSEFLFAGYDSPFHFYNRRNEVWIFADK